LKKNLFFFFPSCVFEFSWSVPSKNTFMGTWECQNRAGSPPPHHNSIGIFCWGRSLNIQREIKREVAISNQLQYITNLYKYVSFVQGPSFKNFHGSRT
jgi:hypothetical protein